MRKRNTLIGLAILLAAVGSTALIVRNNNATDTATTTHSTGSMMSEHELSTLEAQSSDAYDKMFITMMSEHHAGAVAMANLVVNDAKHPELKALAQNIITAQTKELADMKTWAATWGYTYVQPSQSAIDDMTSSLKGKTGDALDKQFLADMIGHHQSALDMAELSSTRAKHDEIKVLSSNIQTTQTKEIAQMKGFATEWGYKLESTDASMHM